MLMGTRGVFKLGTIGGIAVKAHWSWALVLLLITFDLAAGYFPKKMPGEGDLTYWALGLVAALMLFVSVLLHELSHSFVARARGLKVRDIVLFIFGGVSNIETEPERARDEFAITVVGPLTSFVLAGVFFGLAAIIPADGGALGRFALAVFQYLSFINFLLALFNMIPGFPLDGGRVLRSIIWGATGNFQTATRAAGMVGQLVAYGFIFLGLYQSFFLNDFGGGLWMAFIGWFLLSAAQESVTGTVVKETLRNITVGQLMDPAPHAAAPHMTIAQLLTQFILPGNQHMAPVAQDGRAVGIITLSDIKDVPQEDWGSVTVGDRMTRGEQLRTVRPQDNLTRAMELLGEGDFDQLLVVDAAGQLVGVLTRAQVLRWLHIRDELKLRQQGAGAPVASAPPR